MDQSIAYKQETDEYILKIEGVEYSNENIKVYFNLKNKSDKPIKTIHFKYELEDSKFEEEFNSLGYQHFTNEKGWIYNNESVEGYYNYYFKREIKITKINAIIE